MHSEVFYTQIRYNDNLYSLFLNVHKKSRVLHIEVSTLSLKTPLIINTHKHVKHLIEPRSKDGFIIQWPDNKVDFYTHDDIFESFVLPNLQ